MKLNLKRPIVFFDLETTGVNVCRDRIVEISYIKVMPDGREIEKTYRVNPEMHIPEESTAVHHITDEDVAGAPVFKTIAATLIREFTGCDFAGFNSNRFDIPMLAEEFARAGKDFDFTRARFIDVQNIFHKKEQRTLVAAYRFYCNADLEAAHSANADTRATYEVLQSQLDRYPDLVNDVAALSEFSSQNRNVDLAGRLVRNPQGVITVNFGKYKGMPVCEVLDKDPGYFGWIQQGDFTEDTKKVFRQIKLNQLS